MLRWFFIAVHLTLAVVLAGVGIAAYRMPGAVIDAGVTALFCAAWFGFAGVGFYLRHVWFVTIASMALFSLAMLYLFLASADLYARGGGTAPIPWASISVVLGLLGLLFAGEIYAVVLARREAVRRQPEKKSRNFGDRRIKG
jgi:hypothetical protein